MGMMSVRDVAEHMVQAGFLATDLKLAQSEFPAKITDKSADLYRFRHGRRRVQPARTC